MDVDKVLYKTHFHSVSLHLEKLLGILENAQQTIQSETIFQSSLGKVLRSTLNI